MPQIHLYSLLICLILKILIIHIPLHCHGQITSRSQHEIFPIAENLFGVEVPRITAHLRQVIHERLINRDGVKISLQLINRDALSSCLQVNQESGEFRVKRPIDRESICPSHGPVIDMDAGRTASLLEADCIRPIDILLRYHNTDGTSAAGHMPPETYSINLAIIDVNDNPPKWPSPRVFIKFTETTDVDPSATKVQIKSFPCAKDVDYMNNATITYRLVGGGADMFELSVNCSLAEILSVSPKARLDREADHFPRDGIFNLTVLATDNGPNSLSSSLNLDIAIIDVNDNAPIFHFHTNQNMPVWINNGQLNGGYHVEIVETTPLNSVVLSLNATDADSLDNGRVSYSFCPCEHSEASQFFEINPNSGIITTKRTFDYDRGIKSFNFKVIATDGAIEPYTQTSTTTVHLAIRDTNDEVPQIKVSIINSVSVPSHPSNSHSMANSINEKVITAHLKENTQVNELFALVQIIDNDLDDEVTCHLGSRDNFTLVKGEKLSMTNGQPTEFQVYTGWRLDRTDQARQSESPFDRETMAKQNLSIICQDNAGNRAIQEVIVTLIDENDNAPQFTREIYEFSIDENMSSYHGRGIEIGKVYASDKDSGNNARIEYSLISDDVGGYFEVDSTTGQLFLHTQLDREAGPLDGRYHLRVFAKDGGSPKSLENSTEVIVRVLDLNDMPPEFGQESYIFDVPEDVTLGTIIGRVVAFDRDSEGLNDSIRYRFARQSELDPHRLITSSSYADKNGISDSMAQVYFGLNEKTGELKVVRNLDRESISTFLFSILAEDAPLQRSDKRLSSIARVTVSVSDINDNSPKFSQPEVKKILKLPVSTLPGKFLMQFSATDLDEGENGRIDYHIRPEILTGGGSQQAANLEQATSLLNIFSVDENSGSLILLNGFKSPATYRVIVEACDNGPGPLCTNSPPLELIVLDKESLNDGDLFLLDQGNGDFNTWSNSQYQTIPGIYDNNAQRKNFTIILCLCIIFLTVVVALVLIFCVFKRTSATSPESPHILNGPRNRVFWKSLFYNRNDGPMYHQKAIDMAQSKDACGFNYMGEQSKFIPPMYTRRMTPNDVYSKHNMYQGSDLTLQKRALTGYGLEESSPVYQSLDRIDLTSSCHNNDYQRPHTSIPKNLPGNGYFYNPSEEMYHDNQGQTISFYAMASKNTEIIPKHSEATISCTISTKTTDSLTTGEKQKSPLITNADDEEADAEISQYTSKMSKVSTPHKHEIKAYTEGSFV